MNLLTSLKKLVLLVPFTAAISCVEAGAVEADDVGVAVAPIIGGEKDNHVAVVRVDTAGGMCSGVYLGSGAVLTAAHCVDGVSQAIVTFVHADDPANNRAVASSSILTYQGYVGDAGQSEDNDLAVIFLDFCFVPSFAETLPLLGSSNGTLAASDVGKTVSIVGFGRTEPGPKSDTSLAAGERRIGRTALSKVESGHVEIGEEDDEARSCFGDSGGPLLFEVGGVEHVAAIDSRGHETCEGADLYTRVDTGKNAEFIGAAALAALLSLHSCGDETSPTRCSVEADRIGGGSGGGVGLLGGFAAVASLLVRRKRARSV